MSLNDRQALRQLLRTPRFWFTTIMSSVELGLKFGMFPLSGHVHDAVFVLVFVAMLGGTVGVGLWQAPRAQWNDEQKRRESMRLILAGKPPLQGYDYLLDAPPWTRPLPPPEDKP